MSIPSIHAEKVADIRFRNEEGGRTKEGRKDSSFAFLSHSASAIVSQSGQTDAQTELSLFHLGELASVVMYGNKTFSHL